MYRSLASRSPSVSFFPWPFTVHRYLLSAGSLIYLCAFFFRFFVHLSRFSFILLMYISYFDGRSSSKSFSWTNLPRRSFVSYFDILFSRLAVPFYFLTMPFLFSISRRSCFSPSCRSSMLPYSDVPVFLLRRSSFSSLDIPVIPTLPFLSVSLPCRSSVRYLAVLLFPALPFLCFETYRSSVLPYHAVPLLPI